MRDEYVRRMGEIRGRFDADGNGQLAVEQRTALVDSLLNRLWADEGNAVVLNKGIAVVAVGGYGRGQLFPQSDVDVLFCMEKGCVPKDAIRRVTQALWDCGIRISPVIRLLNDCERFHSGNVELGFSLLDRRMVAGDAAVAAKLEKKITSKMLVRDLKMMRSELQKLTRERHSRYGDTLFHLEPNIKECPGGLRDANVCGWLSGLRHTPEPLDNEFCQSVRFLMDLRCFLHYRHERDDNVLDWLAQDGAAEAHIGVSHAHGHKVDAAYWMRAYFRHARVVERGLMREMEAAGVKLQPATGRKIRVGAADGFRLREGRLELDIETTSQQDPAEESSVVLALFGAMAHMGAPIGHITETRIAECIPLLSAHLEEGPRLWRALRRILEGEFAGNALRAMHALGVLDLIMPEFHGIDALVIRDAYHRYTVDEHTFVLIDTLHELRRESSSGAPEWRQKLGQMARELQNPSLLFLAALLHDTGKGRTGENHARESARMAQAIMTRLEMDAYDSGLVLRLIETHLEMSATLRRDIFDDETVKTFVNKVQTHEALRMLTLFTYADIQAVHPDAMTPWKAENLWRLEMKAAIQMDRGVDDERVHVRAADERVERALALLPGREEEIKSFLEGFPERYLATRSPDDIRQHFEMVSNFAEEEIQIALQTGAAMNQVTLVTHDRPMLFAGIAGALAAWGMNVVTADGFANARGEVVDNFRFTDLFRTLELNLSERERFVDSIRDSISGRVAVETMLAGRRRGRKKIPLVAVETRVDFDEEASIHSTLLQVVAQDVPGLLRAISQTFSDMDLNVEVALVDTEGETAIDVFYLTHQAGRLTADKKDELSYALLNAIDANARRTGA